MFVYTSYIYLYMNKITHVLVVIFFGDTGKIKAENMIDQDNVLYVPVVFLVTVPYSVLCFVFFCFVCLPRVNAVIQ